MEAPKVQLFSIKNVPDGKWEKLSTKRIFFGHQSVGFNIIDGIKDVMEENPQIKLNIVETNNASDFGGPIFSHSRVGHNLAPKSKIDTFSDVIKGGLGERLDIAFFKFCYVDIEKGADITGLFEDYKTKMSQLQKDYPGIKFIHVSVPLRVTKTTWKTWIKDLIGKGDLYEFAGNIERNQYNNLLRKEYNGKEQLFDLANVESTYPDGPRSSFNSKGMTYYSLVHEYTKDGGHLNEKGRRAIAEQLLIFVANLT